MRAMIRYYDRGQDYLAFQTMEQRGTSRFSAHILYLN
jgi:hypothetical protein